MILAILITTILSLVKRNEEYQPILTNDFPHLLGINRLKAWMDPTLNPCDDFYKYSCNGFKKRYSDYNDTNIIKLMSKTNSLLMEMILNRTSDPLAITVQDQDIFTKTRNYYLSCAKRDVIDSRGYEPFRTMALVLLSKFDRDISLPRLLGQLQATSGVHLTLQSKYTSVPTKNIKQLRLQFVPAAAYNITRETIQDIVDGFVDEGLMEENQDIVDTIYEFEKRHLYFGKHLNHRHRLGGDKPDQFKTLSQLSQETGLNWLDYVQELKLPDVEKIHLWAGSENWVKEIEYLSLIPHKDLKFIALWRLAVAHYNKLPEPYYSAWQNGIFKKSLRLGFYSVDSAVTFTRHDCVKETGANLKYLAGHLYVKYAFNATQKERATVLVDDLFAVLRKRFRELDWMDRTTQDAAIKKLDNLEKVVGVPDWVLDAKKVSDYYKPLDLRPDTYFENAVQAGIFTELMPSIRHSRSHTNEREGLFKDHMWLLNAVHLVNLVQIQINPGFLQRPLFSALNTRAMNYGSLGGVIAHEISHAFDSYGSLYDAEGVRRPWMSRKARHGFNQRAQCFVEQYNNMVVEFQDGEEGWVNGRHTLTENIADNGGMHTAYKAWLQNAQNSNEKVDGLSEAQIFWIAFAQTNCDVQSDGKLKRQLVKDVHSPKIVRVNGAVSNSREFAEAFGCKNGDGMWRENTCRIL